MMEVKGENHVTFPSEKASDSENRSGIHFKTNNNFIEEHRKKPIRNVNITCKYDRKQMRVRLEVEEWMYDRLQELYDCKDGDDAPLEIDIDGILGVDDADKKLMLKDLLKEATQPVDEFITELLQKIQTLKKNSSTPSRVTMEMDL